MKFIRSIKLFIPPILWRVIRKIAMIPDRQNPFEDVFEHIEQVNVTGYNSVESLNEMYELMKKKFESYLNKKSLPESSPLSPISNLFPLLIAALGQKRETISVLDFGGGMGGGD